MFKSFVVVITCLFSLFSVAQDYSSLWQGHFSYNNIKDVVRGNDKLYAASENAVFSLDLVTQELTELSTVNGLSGESISTIYYSDLYELLLIGYENGLIEIAFDNNDNILTVVDIIDKVTIPPTDKRINHFNVFDNLVYIATNYGISVYDLERLEFGDTYFIGSGGTQVKVSQTAIFGGFIYAACLGGNGLKKAQITNSNLIDYQNWGQVVSGDFLAVESVGDKLYAIRTNRRLYNVANDVLTERFLYADAPLDMRSVGSNLLVTTKNDAFVYDESFNLITQASVNPSFSTLFNVATIDSETIYVGTKDFGILKAAFTNPNSFEEIHPEGPLLNTPFSIKAIANNLWVTFGEYDIYYNPYPNGGPHRRGFSHLKEEKWINVPYSEVLGARSLNAISVNLFNNDQVFISSFFSGLLEVNEEEPTILYDQTNSGLESLVLPSNPNYVDIRVGPTVFDGNGLLWITTSRVDNALKSFNPSSNQWRSYSFSSIISDPLNEELGFGDIAIGSDNTKWIGSYNHGVIGVKDSGSNFLLKHLSGEEVNMPTEYVTALAMDKRNQLWIGTFRGLRVLYNTSNFFTDDNVRAEEIVILEDGIAKELLFQQIVTDIEVDGANNKWIGTAGSGLFYFSSDGQKTIFHFTKDNAPLPSNTINDVSLDESNGIVYVATSKGLVSFRSGSSGTQENLQGAYAYPNPVRPGFNIVEEKVKIKDISENVNIKITDIEGNLVAEAQSRTNQRYSGYNLEIDGGTAYWNGKNLANNIVASGVYLVMLSDLDTYETKVLKIMVVR
ncbi:type IX secretion system anionic LPS delivery protein PorZ [Snuella sedimenti]|uniref:ABC transporter substrate-binding protein n=1 Tax=Snuella sedimenti TaxID=2798802 RepID=A0A8J7IP12_9FLAO|nr:two-component regulator propeller domain-containing protein [Snuella sedimenti]MBJ6368262.1 ABC transporter substrate-binding protein [Snuella sedimenti]